jgi:uncharacterized membrane protein
VIAVQKSILFVTRYWYLLMLGLTWLVLALGFLAPLLLALGLPGAAQWCYEVLAPHNHQLPQRSYFLFGEAGVIQTYTVGQLIGQGADPLNLQSFTGNADIGYKTALNHRMIAIFGAMLIGGLGWGLAKGQPRVKVMGLLLLALPLLVDGLSHMVSEDSGLGFRETNAWAMTLTGGSFSPEFYTGITVGTLNWWLRTVTGSLFGLGLVWFLCSYLSARFAPIRAKLEPKLRRVGAVK